VKNYLFGFVILFACAFGQLFAEAPPLLSATFVEVEKGEISDNTLLASDDGTIFIEFSKDTKFVDAEEKLNFTGEILPPQTIELEFDPPRALLEELATFELVSNAGADIAFLDRYDRMSRKNLLLENLRSPDELKKKSSWVKLVYPLKDSLVSMPKLWEWQGESKGWKRIGGTVEIPPPIVTEGEEVLYEETVEENRVFSAILRRTGIYAIFDENPPPRHFADEYEIPPKGYLLSDPTLSEEIYGDNDLGFAEDEEFVDFGVSDFSEEIPSADDSENMKLLQDFQQKMEQNSAKLAEDSEIKQKTDRLIILLNKRIAKEKVVKQKKAELEAIAGSLEQAETPEIRSNLEKSFLEIQSSLYKLEQEDPTEEAEFITLKKEVDDFFAGIALSEETSDELKNQPPNKEIQNSPPEEELYIPKNAELVKSGADEEQRISWVFPVFLLICFGLLAWGIFSATKKGKFE
jgi:hypothetical protein